MPGMPAGFSEEVVAIASERTDENSSLKRNRRFHSLLMQIDIAFSISIGVQSAATILPLSSALSHTHIHCLLLLAVVIKRRRAHLSPTMMTPMRYVLLVLGIIVCSSSCTLISRG